jgi:hypothetical protein
MPELVGPLADAEPEKAPRFLILKDMMARTSPNLAAVKWPIQDINAGAVLNGTGR